MLLSIIIPVFNVEKYIEACIDSILRLNFGNYELLLIDDGSTDRSGEICDDYSRKHAVIKTYHIENGGPSKARNYGLNLAQGDYIQFVDSDDEVTAGFISAFESIRRDCNPDLIIGTALIVDANKIELRRLSTDHSGNYTIQKILDRIKATDKEIFLHYIWNKWYKREIIEKYNIKFNEKIKLGEDFLFNCDFFDVAENVAISPAKMYMYFDRNRLSLTGAFIRDEIERRRLVDNKYLNLLKTKGVYNKDTFDSQIGAITFQSLQSISKDSCKLSKKEKAVYIRTFAESEYGDYLEAYSKTINRISWKKIVIKAIKNKQYRKAVAIITLRAAIRKRKW